MIRYIVVSIADTDPLREVCSGMWGGKDAYIESESLLKKSMAMLKGNSRF
jgi:hypothetical protein